MPKQNVAERFFDRFAGLDRAHGSYIPKDVADKSTKKLGGSARTVREGATVELWTKHLAGTYGLGIVPIRDDGTVRWGAIDIDVYDLNHTQLEEAVNGFKLPLILCATKSGGAHLYLFLTEDVPAGLVRGKLMDWAVALGYPTVEVFPKQTKLASERDVGNWINMPYFGATRQAMRAGIWLKTPAAFLDYAETRAITKEALEKFSLSLDTPELAALLDNAPPCLQSLARNGLDPGTRNNGLFNFGVYLKKRYGENYNEQLDAINQQFMRPPLGHKEVAQIVKQLSRKTYEYRCHEQPIVSCCNRQICLTRKYGVGRGNENDPGVVFGGLVKILTDPPIWIWDVDGERIELTTAQLKDQMQFHARCVEVLNKWPQPMKAGPWSDLIREKLENVEEQTAPPDASMDGLIRSMLTAYCATRAPAEEKEELLLNRPWTHRKRVYFSGVDFKRYLEQQRIRVTQKELWNALRKGGAAGVFMKLKGKGMNLWHMPATAIEVQQESFREPTPKDESESEEM